MTNLDWHSAPLSRETPLDPGFRISQNVRRFIAATAGQTGSLNLPREFHLWLKAGEAKTLGDVVDEWQRRYGQTPPAS